MNADISETMYNVFYFDINLILDYYSKLIKIVYLIINFLYYCLSEIPRVSLAGPVSNDGLRDMATPWSNCRLTRPSRIAARTDLSPIPQLVRPIMDNKTVGNKGLVFSSKFFCLIDASFITQLVRSKAKVKEREIKPHSV